MVSPISFWVALKRLFSEGLDEHLGKKTQLGKAPSTDPSWSIIHKFRSRGVLPDQQL